MNQPLNSQLFESIISHTPLVSIDFVVRNKHREVLLGVRKNRPAQGYWFVPGGRIYKNESIAQAFKRLTKAELGGSVSIADARYHGLYEHFYEDNFFGTAASTHYVVNCFEITILDDAFSRPDEQHENYRWFSEAEVLASDKVHVHSKWYFDKSKGYL